MTVKVELNDDQTVTVLTENKEKVALIVASAKQGVLSLQNQFVFFAAFDGTNNDLENQGNQQTTNVAALWNQYLPLFGKDPNCGGGYYPGPGTKGTQTFSSWMPADVTHQVILTAQNAYREFTSQCVNWIQQNPKGSVAVALTSFSRGGASAAIFSQMLYAKGLTNPQTDQILIDPLTLGVTAGIIFDPVMSGVSGNLAFAPTTTNVVDILAENEYRYLFKGADYSKQNGVRTVMMYGNHCDIGGGYDNGIAALTLDAATRYLQASGLKIGNVPTSRNFDTRRPIVVHDESVDDFGHPIWDSYHEFSFKFSRLLDGVCLPTTQTLDGQAAFTLYNGDVLTA